MDTDTLLRHAKDLAIGVIEASLYWTGDDEEKNPQLKRIRTLAADLLKEIEKYAVTKIKKT